MLGVVASGAMPRTTFDLDPSVLDQLRRRATHEGKSMGQVASEMLAPALAEGEQRPEARPLRWTTRKMGTPKIDLEDKETLWLSLDREQLEKDAS